MQRNLFLVILFICIIEPINAFESINEFMWDFRIILFHAPEGTEEVFNTLSNLEQEIQDRDIYWFVFTGSRLKTNYKGKIKKQFYRETLENYFTDTENNLILIGKDGGIKKKSKFLDLQNIFDLIDTMPMRLLEMRQRY